MINFNIVPSETYPFTKLEISFRGLRCWKLFWGVLSTSIFPRTSSLDGISKAFLALSLEDVLLGEQSSSSLSDMLESDQGVLVKMFRYQMISCSFKYHREKEISQKVPTMHVACWNSGICSISILNAEGNKYFISVGWLVDYLGLVRDLLTTCNKSLVLFRYEAAKLQRFIMTSGFYSHSALINRDHYERHHTTVTTKSLLLHVVAEKAFNEY